MRRIVVEKEHLARCQLASEATLSGRVITQLPKLQTWKTVPAKGQGDDPSLSLHDPALINDSPMSVNLLV